MAQYNDVSSDRNVPVLLDVAIGRGQTGVGRRDKCVIV